MAALVIHFEIPDEGIHFNNIERRILIDVLMHCHWSVTEAARLLRTPPQTVWWRMTVLGITRETATVQKDVSPHPRRRHRRADQVSSRSVSYAPTDSDEAELERLDREEELRRLRREEIQTPGSFLGFLGRGGAR